MDFSKCSWLEWNCREKELEPGWGWEWGSLTCPSEAVESKEVF
jgi:hypothetical protein